MTSEERIASLHARMRGIRRRRERQKTMALGMACCALTVFMASMIMNDGAHQGSTAGLYSGATMLFENAGGYVLAAVAAFMAGVVITVLCIRLKNKP